MQGSLYRYSTKRAIDFNSSLCAKWEFYLFVISQINGWQEFSEDIWMTGRNSILFEEKNVR